MGSSRGSTCLKMNASGTIFQQCSGSASADLCEHFGSPAACCTTPSKQQIICSGSSGFANPPSSADFSNCLASCGQDGGHASNAEMMSTSALVIAFGVVLALSGGSVLLE